MAILPLENTPTFDYDRCSIEIILTVITPLEKINNSRWYCNQLSDNDDIADNNCVSTISIESEVRVRSD